MNQVAGLKRILIFDDDADFRKLLITYLRKLLEGVELEEYDPVARGVPGEAFDWSRYDVLILDYYLCIHNVTGLDILQANRKNKLFPAAIMLTGAGNEETAVRALKAGVYDYLRKEKLDKQQLRASILDAFEKHKEEMHRRSELTNQSNAFNKALFYQQLEHPEHELGRPGRILLLIQLDDHEALEDRLGIILRDNVVRHLARQSYEVFQLGECEPQITRLSDHAVALLINNPGSHKTLEFNLQGLCTHLKKHPYKFEDRKFRFTVSIGVVTVPAEGASAEMLIHQAREASEAAVAVEGNSFSIYEDLLRAEPAKPAAAPEQPTPGSQAAPAAEPVMEKSVEAAPAIELPAEPLPVSMPAAPPLDLEIEVEEPEPELEAEPAPAGSGVPVIEFPGDAAAEPEPPSEPIPPAASQPAAATLPEPEPAPAKTRQPEPPVPPPVSAPKPELSLEPVEGESPPSAATTPPADAPVPAPAAPAAAPVVPVKASLELSLEPLEPEQPVAETSAPKTEVQPNTPAPPAVPAKPVHAPATPPEPAPAPKVAQPAPTAAKPAPAKAAAPAAVTGTPPAKAAPLPAAPTSAPAGTAQKPVSPEATVSKPAPATSPSASQSPTPPAAAAPTPTASSPAPAPAAKPVARDELDEGTLSPTALKLKKAFDHKRVVQTFQPVISLTAEDGREMHVVCLQLIDTAGGTVDEQAIYADADTPPMVKFIDRWQLRESIGRVVNSPESQYLFLLKISAASLSDPALFNWLRKALTGLETRRPGNSIALEVTAADFERERKKAAALISYLSGSHGFRFAMSGFSKPEEFTTLPGPKSGFHMLRLNFELFDALRKAPTPEGGVQILQQFGDAGLEIIVDQIKDSTMLTEAIGAGAAYAMGPFIGEATSRLEDTTNVESFEIA